MGPLRRRQLQPGDDLIDALFIGKVIVEMQIIRGPPAINFGLRTGPEEAGAAHALFFRQAPQGGASIPASVAIRLWITVGVSLFARRIVELVGHDAVMLGIEAGHQGVVIGKGQRRVGRDHSLVCDGSLRSQLQQMLGAIFPGIVVAKAVKRDQHNVGLGLLCSRVGPMVDGDDLGPRRQANQEEQTDRQKPDSLHSCSI